jgi:hypothetical protein
MPIAAMPADVCSTVLSHPALRCKRLTLPSLSCPLRLAQRPSLILLSGIIAVIASNLLEVRAVRYCAFNCWFGQQGLLGKLSTGLGSGHLCHSRRHLSRLWSVYGVFTLIYSAWLVARVLEANAQGENGDVSSETVEIVSLTPENEKGGIE